MSPIGILLGTEKLNTFYTLIISKYQYSDIINHTVMVCSYTVGLTFAQLLTYLIWPLDVPVGDPHDQQANKNEAVEDPYSQTVTVY